MDLFDELDRYDEHKTADKILRAPFGYVGGITEV